MGILRDAFGILFLLSLIGSIPVFIGCIIKSAYTRYITGLWWDWFPFMSFYSLVVLILLIICWAIGA